MTAREQEALELIERVRARPPRFRDPQITMAHGAGGKATGTLIEGLLAPALGLETLADAAAIDGLALTTTASSSSRFAFPAARSASSRSTAPSTTSPCRERARSR